MLLSKTIKTNGSKFLTFFENTILNNIDLEAYEITLTDKFEIVNKVYEIFLSEYVHEFNKNLLEDAPIKLFASYLQGLPTVLTVPFMNYEILENAKAYGFILDVENLKKVCPLPNKKGEVITSGKTEQLEDDFLKNYWFNCASAFFTLKENL